MEKNCVFKAISNKMFQPLNAVNNDETQNGSVYRKVLLLGATIRGRPVGNQFSVFASTLQLEFDYFKCTNFLKQKILRFLQILAFFTKVYAFKNSK